MTEAQTGVLLGLFVVVNIAALWVFYKLLTDE